MKLFIRLGPIGLKPSNIVSYNLSHQRSIYNEDNTHVVETGVLITTSEIVPDGVRSVNKAHFFEAGTQEARALAKWLVEHSENLPTDLAEGISA